MKNKPLNINNEIGSGTLTALVIYSIIFAVFIILGWEFLGYVFKHLKIIWQ